MLLNHCGVSLKRYAVLIVIVYNILRGLLLMEIRFEIVSRIGTRLYTETDTNGGGHSGTRCSGGTPCIKCKC